MKNNSECKIGVRVVLEDGRSGVIRFLGPAHFKEGVWAGIELDETLGRNDGKINGHRYFYCPPNHGIFVHPSKVTLACGGPNLGVIVESTPVKNPLTFPSFDRTQKVKKTTTIDYKNTLFLEPSSQLINTESDSNKLLKDKISSLSLKIEHLEKENHSLRMEVNLSREKNNTCIQALVKKCRDLKGKVDDIKRFLLEVRTAKLNEEKYFETELERLKTKLKTDQASLVVNDDKYCEVLQIEKTNINTYMDWIFHLRRNKEKFLPSVNEFNEKLTSLNGASISSLENIYICIKKLVGSFICLKSQTHFVTVGKNQGKNHS